MSQELTTVWLVEDPHQDDDDAQMCIQSIPAYMHWNRTRFTAYVDYDSAILDAQSRIAARAAETRSKP